MKWIRNPTPLIILRLNKHIRFLEHHRSQLLLLDDSQHGKGSFIAEVLATPGPARCQYYSSW